MMIGDFLMRVTTALDMHGIPYMLTGSLACSMYGEPRSTNDIDIVIEPTRPQLMALVQLFQRLGMFAQPEAALAAFHNWTQFNVMDSRNCWKVDLIFRKRREFSATEFQRRETHEVQGMRLTVATAEDVVLSKLEWNKIGESERQLNDVAGILKLRSDTLDFDYIEHWVDVLDLRQQWDAAKKRIR